MCNKKGGGEGVEKLENLLSKTARAPFYTGVFEKLEHLFFKSARAPFCTVYGNHALDHQPCATNPRGF
jgi:hypothetical protein